MDTENPKNFRFKVGDKVYYQHDLCTIETVDTNDESLPYRIERNNGYLLWTTDEELVTKEIYESPLYKIMQGVEND